MESVTEPIRAYRTKTDSKREQLEVTSLHIKGEQQRAVQISDLIIHFNIPYKKKRIFQIKSQQKVKNNNDWDRN